MAAHVLRRILTKTMPAGRAIRFDSFSVEKDVHLCFISKSKFKHPCQIEMTSTRFFSEESEAEKNAENFKVEETERIGSSGNWNKANVTVPNEIATMLVGKNSRTKRLMEQFTCSKISMFRGSEDRDGFLTCSSKNEKKVREAEEQIHRFIQFAKDTKFNKIPDDWITKTVLFPEPDLYQMFRSRLLGLEGNRINRLRWLTSCVISLDNDEPVLTISGKTEEQVVICQRIINEEMRGTIGMKYKQLEDSFTEMTK